MPEVKMDYGLNWVAKPTKEGFVYFYIPGTNTYQWAFPKIYDPQTQSQQYLFVSHWVKKAELDKEGFEQRFWQHK